jgi:ABC-type oligopeptide transport system substrate-binding subunit
MMRKKIVFIMTLTMSVGLVACGSSSSTTSETTAAPESVVVETQAVETQVAETSEVATSTVEATVAESKVDEGTEVDVGGPYPASTAWDEYSVTDYHFDETDEDVTMTIQTNTAHDTFDMQFDFFGDKQQITFHSDETVDYDLSGFMTKDVKSLVEFVSGITDWAPIE